MSCPVCGVVPRDGARFCDACGSPLTTAAKLTEYKQVTVLFADVVRSMDLAARLGAERLRELMTELFNRSARVVQQYGGTVDKFTGDGIMAEFGAPIALEDHPARACRAALDIQRAAQSLAVDVGRLDHVALQLRVGLNSGQVIAGAIGSDPLSYTAIGEQVGMAQRMESVAPPGGVMLSESTARLVESVAVLGEPELVSIKGAARPVPARRLLAMASGRRTGRSEPAFVGREHELATLRAVVDRSIDGTGGVVGVVGPAGIGKSRLVRELTSVAAAKGVQVVASFCESHTTEVPFHAIAGLLRTAAGLSGLEAAPARSRLRQRFSGLDGEDVLLVEDLLGVTDAGAELSGIDPEARRRRLSAIVNPSGLVGTEPALFVIEDVHWIDGISESMFADFLKAVPQTRSAVVITYRPEYAGTLTRNHETVSLEPLDDAQISALSTELLGADSSVADLAGLVAKRAAGNPFFAEEIVRDLSERDVLIGGRGCYLCADPVADVSVPSTLQAVIAARIDRLGLAAKRTLNAAAVIGSRFDQTLLSTLVTPVLDELVAAELVEPIASGARPEYAFRHPLIRAVAYESQLKADRAQLHRNLTEAIVHDDQHSALIAEHFEAAGDLPQAYEWHMRAAAWSANRDIEAAQLNWERARLAADALPQAHPDRPAMRISPRILLCANAWRRFHPDISARFDELRQLCEAAGDKLSLAIGMTGLTMEHMLGGRIRAASALASEYMAVIESLGDPLLVARFSRAACTAKLQAGEVADVLRWSQTTIDLTGTDPIAHVFRAVGRWTTGHPGWREDLANAVALARTADAVAQAAVMTYKYIAISRGIVLADDRAVAELEDALCLAERTSDEIAIVLIRSALGIVLVHHAGADSSRGYAMLAELRETCVRRRYALHVLPILNVYIARGMVANGDIDGGLEHLEAACVDILGTGGVGNLDLATVALVETLLARGGAGDLARAQAALDRLDASLGEEVVWVSRAVTGLRLRALIALARGDQPTYRELKRRYREVSTDLGFEGHMAWAAEMA
ncbi:adenylate/guanylate cyclase domain-containing protein [Mycobacterium sp. NPDC003449]